MGRNQSEPTDRFLSSAAGRHRNLKIYANSGYEHRIYDVRPGRKGSLWITPQRRKYRIQTTGMAQSIDIFIERQLGIAVGSQKINEYKFWYTTDSGAIERVIEEFAKS